MTWGEDVAAKLLGSAVPARFSSCVATWESPAAACALISLEDLKTILGITDSSQDDELTRLIGVYSAAIEGYIERRLCLEATEVVYVARTLCQRPSLWLPQYPVVSVESVEHDGAAMDAADWLVDGRTGELYPLRGPWHFVSYVLVKYTAGYSPIPPDIEQAIASLVNTSLNSGVGATETGPLKSQRVEGAVTETYYDPRTGETTTGTTGASEITQYYSTLDRYRGERAFI